MSQPMTIMIDLDGVISTEERVFDRPLAKPIDGAREALQRLKDAGHTVVVYTARGWPEYKVTKHWLDQHGMAYDAIHMGKPIAGTTITVECDIPAHPTVEDAAIARRNFSSRLHPLDAERAFPLHMQSMKSRSVQHLTSPVVRPSSLAFRINGSELLRTNVQLPAGGVYPWVLLTSDGDDVTLVSVTAHDAGD